MQYVSIAKSCYCCVPPSCCMIDTGLIDDALGRLGALCKDIHPFID